MKDYFGGSLKIAKLALDLDDVTYIYPNGSLALDHINVKIWKNERVAFLGSNGAGKSTLMMIISGLFQPTKGKVRVFDINVEKANLNKVRAKIGYVFQNSDDQLFCPTLWEDVTFGLLNMGLEDGEIIRRGKYALKTVGLEKYEDKAPHHLSIGEKKKASIATVLAMMPEILILDEPTANLDPKSRLSLIKLINSLYEKNDLTLIVATHDIEFITMTAERAYILNKGRVISEGYLEDIFSNFQIMDETGLELPSITRLFKTLNQLMETEVVHPLPLTIEDAVYKIKQIIMKTSKVFDA